MPRSALLPWSFLLLGAAAVSLGCRKDDVSHDKVAKAASAPLGQELPDGHPPLGGGAAPSMEAAAPSAALPVAWTLPKGWISQGGSGLRAATLKPGADSPVEVSVIALAGSAGGELANVNRWRGQLQLDPIDEKALVAARQTLKAPGGPVTVFDLTGKGNDPDRMVVGTFVIPSGDSWFFKLTGKVGPVGKAKADFLVLMGSLRLANAK